MTKNEFTYRMMGCLSPSSRGLGLRPFTAATGVRLPLGTPLEKLFHTMPPVQDKTYRDHSSWTGICQLEILELQSYCTWGRSSSGRAQRWQRWGKGFDPPRLHHPLKHYIIYWYKRINFNGTMCQWYKCNGTILAQKLLLIRTDPRCVI